MPAMADFAHAGYSGTEHARVPDARRDGSRRTSRPATRSIRTSGAAAPFPDRRASAQRRAPPPAALRLRIPATAAPAPTAASRTTGTRSTQSRWCRAMASSPTLAADRCRAVRPAAMRRRSASRRWAARRSSGRAPTSSSRTRRNARAFPTCSAPSRGMTIERAAELAPDVFWFQLYRFAKNDHRSASIWCGAPMRRARTCSCSPSTCRCAPRARARCAVGIANPFRIELAHGARHRDIARLADGRCGGTACRASPTCCPMRARTPA